MSFGDLKVQDLIYEDSSNNEVTVVIADLAPKANPTFTGTVTVPTAPASDVSTKAASTAFVDSYYATKAAPAFTGSATGVNLTLSGNLVVNGTTTTINTQTLDVEDINITLGKVSSPSDTTANNGGITLKGSSDKTFNWLNATDAWTSSEHIALPDNKKVLFGAGTDLSIWSDGSVGKIQCPSNGGIHIGNTTTTNIINMEPSQVTLNKLLVVQDADFSIRASGTQKMLWDASASNFEIGDGVSIVFPNGSSSTFAGDEGIFFGEGGTEKLRIVNWGNDNASQKSYVVSSQVAGLELRGPSVNLTHGTSEKLTTVNTGVTITGVCTATSFVGDGSSLSNLPAGGNSFTAVAEGAIAANKPVYISTVNGKVLQPSESTSVLASPLVAQTTTHGNNDSRGEGFCSIGGNYFWFGFKNGNSGDDLFGRLGTYNANADTFSMGSSSNVSGTSGSVEHITPIYDSTADKFMIVYRGGSGHSKSLKYQIGVRSSTSLSYGSAAEFQATEGSNNYEHGGIRGAFDPDNRCITYAWMLFGHNRIYVRTAQISTSSSTASLGSRTEILSSQNGVYGVDVCYDTNVDRYVLACTYKNSSNQYVVRFQVGTPGSGTAVSWGNNIEINTGSTLIQEPVLAFDPDSNLVLCVMNDSTETNIVQYPLRITGGSTNTVALADSNSPTIIETNGTDYKGLVYDTLANRMVLGFKDTANSSRPTAMLGTYSENYSGSNDYYTWGTETQLSTASISHSSHGNGDGTKFPLVGLPAGGRAVMYWHPGYPNSQSTALFKITNTTHNLSNHQYVGFPDAAYSNGQTVTIQTEGSVITGLSSLTVMGVVYGDTQNTVGMASSGSAISYQSLGKALTTTSLQVKVAYQ